MPGPRPTPTAELERRGSWRAKSRKNEPQFPASVPSCPKWVGAFGKVEWRRIAKLLAERGVVTAIDRNVLAMYCEAFHQFRVAQQTVAEEGATYISDKGNTLPHPAARDMATWWDKALKAAREFGLTPAARVGLTIKEPKANGNGKLKYFADAG